MKALVYNGPKNVSVKEVPDAINRKTCRRSLRNYDNRKNGWTKVVLKPSAAAKSHRQAASAWA